MKKIDLFIFDLDGTLIDSKKDIAASVNYTMEACGLPKLSTDLIDEFVGNGVTRLIQDSVHAAGGIQFEEAFKIFNAHYLEHLLDTTLPFPGVFDVLKYYSKIPKVVVTNKSQGFSEKVIKGLQLAPYFEGIYGGDTAIPKKPDPAVIHHLLERFSVLPKNAVIIGDSRVDIETGKNAGILTCGVTYGFRPEKELREVGCDVLVGSIGEIVKFFTAY